MTLLEFRAAFGTKEFCRRNGVSRATLYNLWRAGKGPRSFYAGKLRKITREAEAEWHREREAEAAVSQKAAA